jgi:hypothetical protein
MMRNNAHFESLKKTSTQSSRCSTPSSESWFIEVFLIKKQISTLEHYDIDEQNIEALDKYVRQFENKITEDILKINDPDFDKD